MKKENLIIIGSLLAAGLIVFLLILPAWDSLSNTRSGLSQQEDRLMEIQEVATKIKQLDEEYQGNIEDLQKLVAFLPNKEELPSLLVQLESLASANGLIMESVDFTEVSKQKATAGQSKISSESGEIASTKTKNEQLAQEEVTPEVVAAEPYKILSVNLQLIGGYNSFKNYLRAVEKNLRLMDVVSFNFSTQAGQTTVQTIFSFRININVYYQ